MIASDAPPQTAFSNPMTHMLSNAPGLTRAGLAMALLIPPLLLTQSIDPRLFQGINVWIKPLKFAVSLSVYLLTLAYFSYLLPKGFLQRRPVQVFHGVVFFCIAIEMLWIGGAAMYGVGSHFNVADPIMGTIYGIMGIAAVTLTSATLVHGTAIWRLHGKPFPRLVAASFVLTFVLTVPTAGYMSSSVGHHVGTVTSDAQGLWLLGWAREVGDLRVAHFFATHAMQILPACMAILLWLAGARLPRGTGAVLCVSFSALTFGTLVQAINGQPFLPWLT